MYWPLLLAAWYSSAGMERNLSVFIGAPLGFPTATPRGVCRFIRCFFRITGGVPLKRGFFRQKKPPRGIMRLAGFVKQELDVY